MAERHDLPTENTSQITPDFLTFYFVGKKEEVVDRVAG
jgi:hypothetical protein